MTDETTRTKKAGLSPIEVGAGAGAAVITAIASSYLGTAGTLTGAAIASVVGTVSTSVLRNSAKTSADRLKQTTTRLRDTQVEHVRATDVRPVESEDVDPYGTQLFGAPDWIDPEPRAGADRTERPGLAGATGADPGSTWEAPTQRLTSADRTERSGLAGATGADPGSTWEAPTQRLTGADPGRGRVSGSPGGRPYRPGAPDPTPRATGPGATPPAVGAARPGTWPVARAGGHGTSATRPPTRQTGPGASGIGRSGDSAAAAPGLGRVRRRWVVLGAGAAAAFALALGAITGIEAVAGKPLSGLAGRESGGGTTVGRATGADGGSGSTTPSPTPTPSTSGATPTAPAPSTAPSVSPTAPSNPSASNPTPSRTQPTQPAPTGAPSAPNQQAP